ncbi:unnamed protein product, partial [Mesorhabditis belari]|uniref:Uncharacterized protein n=1 Tax=Mesorhabditis belari TaxID=2138241 RepID=A0AAF3EW82_9BILA
MAREKHRSVTVGEMAGLGVTIPSSETADHKSKIHQQMHFRSGQQPKSAPQSARGNKTLAWFLTDSALEKKINLASSSAPIKQSNQTQLTQEKMLNQGVKDGNERRKKRVHRKAKEMQRSRIDSHTSPSEGSANSESPGDEKQKIVTDFKEDYWYYDVATDGYYYEQNGAKGWRRRQPNADPKKQQETVASSPTEKVAPTAANPPAATTAGVSVDPRALQLLQQALYGQPAYKYYDPNSDGYYYEMASVDGWRKRQPTRPASQQAPRLPTATPIQHSAFQSYGAALARGQMPRNCIISESSSSSSSSEADQAIQELFLSQMEDLSLEALSRPNKLTGTELRNPTFNPDRFLENFVFPDQGFDLSSSTRTPLTPLKTSTSALETPRGPFEMSKAANTQKSSEMSPMWGGWGYNGFGSLATGRKEDDLLGSSLLGDLQKIWQSPTPTA